MATKIITAQSQMRAAQSFSFFSIVSILVPPVILIWIAASIFVYAAVANHPNLRVRDFLTHSGYRFYGLVGGLVAVLNFSPQLAKWAGGGMQLIEIIWVIAFLVVVPLGVRDILRAKKEPWKDFTLETDDE
jgi:hypothetical protein